MTVQEESIINALRDIEFSLDLIHWRLQGLKVPPVTAEFSESEELRTALGYLNSDLIKIDSISWSISSLAGKYRENYLAYRQGSSVVREKGTA